jgi:hypothetical protein
LSLTPWSARGKFLIADRTPAGEVGAGYPGLRSERLSKLEMIISKQLI